MNIMEIVQINDTEFLRKIYTKKEYFIHRVSETEEQIEGDSLNNNQKIVENFINPYTPYQSLLLFWTPGSGKTIGGCVIAVSYTPIIERYRSIGYDAKIYVIIKGGQMKRHFLETLSMKMISGEMFITDAMREKFEQLKIKYTENSTYSNMKKMKRMAEQIKNKFVKNGPFVFMTYEKFRKALDGTNVTKRISKMDYSLLIFDEAHEIETNKAQDLLLRVKAKSKHLKILLMTATPMSTYPDEIIDVLNFLRQDLLEHNTYFNGHDLKKSMVEKLGRKSRGYVSAYKVSQDDEHYPKKIIMGELLPGFKKLKMVQCKMSQYQYDTYNTILPENYDIDSKTIARDIERIVDIILPNPSGKIGLIYSKESFKIIKSASKKWRDKYDINFNEDAIAGNFYNYENIGQYSMKYKTLLDNILDAISDPNDPKNILIFHKEVFRGVKIVNEILLANGFQNVDSKIHENGRCYLCGKFRSETHNGHAFGQAKFALLHGDISIDIREKYLATYRSEENIHGKLIKLVVGSTVLGESLDFNRLRQVHLLQYQKSLNNDEQVIGRAVRYNSHADLPKKQRTVEIFRYVSMLRKKPELSPELIKYKIQEKRSLQIDKIENQLRINSFDCALYMDKCILTKLPKIIDTTTFDTYFYQDEMNIYRLELERLFNIFPIWTYEQIQEIIYKRIQGTTLVPYNNFLYLAMLLQDMIDAKTKLYVGKNVGYIIYRGIHYIFQPIYESEYITLEDRFRILNMKKMEGSRTEMITLNAHIKETFDQTSKMNFKQIMNNILNSSNKFTFISELTVKQKTQLIMFCIESSYNKIKKYKNLWLIVFDFFKPILIDKRRFEQNSYDSENIGDTGYFGAILNGHSICYNGKNWNRCMKLYTTHIAKKLKLNKYCGFHEINENNEQIFKILILKNDTIFPLKEAGDRREKSRGRECININPKEDLLKIAKNLGIVVSKETIQKKICKIVKEKLFKLNSVTSKRYFIDYLELEVLRKNNVVDF